MELEQVEGTGAVARRSNVGVGVITALLALSFLASWVMLDRHFLNAAGESVGSTFALGVIASLVAAVRGAG